MCIEFQGFRLPKGYGRVRYEGKTRLAHRVAYCKHHGLKMADIDGLVVRHKCDNPPCIDPAHLELGTHEDNERDKRERDRIPRGEKCHRAKLKAEQVAEIRRRYKPRDPVNGGTALAREFGVSQENISMIITGASW